MPNDNCDIWIGLPAFNEEVAIERLLEKIRAFAGAHGHRVMTVVYNDGSTDRTAEIAASWQSKLPLVLLGLKENRGLGAGVAALVGYAADHGKPDDVLVIMDCDDTHDPDQIAAMVSRIASGHDLVIASRFRSGATVVGVPRFRRLTAFGAMLLLKALHPVRGALDYTCGYRAYRVSLLRAATQRFGDNLITNRGFACMVELLLKLNLLKPKIAEIPLRLRYDLKPTASKMEVGSHIRRLLKLMLIWRIRGLDAP